MNQEADLPTPVPERPQADEKFALSPNESRFLFVEVAAQRAKQLRRGALIRLTTPAEAAAVDTPPQVHKPERVAMEEVRRGFVQYGLGDAPLTTSKPEDPS